MKTLELPALSVNMNKYPSWIRRPFYVANEVSVAKEIFMVGRFRPMKFNQSPFVSSRNLVAFTKDL